MSTSTQPPSPAPTAVRYDATMRAVIQRRYGSPARLSVGRVPIPAPVGDEVLVRVRASSVNARDWHVMRGEPRIARLMAPGIFGFRGPRQAVPGTDIAGVVEVVGPDVTAWRPGDRVFGEGTGAFADWALAPSTQLARIPDDVPFEQAAAVPLAGVTALEALVAAEPAAGRSILINGASGGVGTFALQLARANGLHVTAVVSPRNAAQARSLGADVTIDYTTRDFTTAVSGYDIVLDLVGNRTLAELRRIVRPLGALVLSGGGVPGHGRVVGPMRLLIQAQIQARRSTLRIVTPEPTPSTESLEHLIELVRSGRVTPVIDRQFTLEEAAAAIDYMETQHTRGKVVVLH